MVSIHWKHWIENKLILTTNFSIYYFLFSWRSPSLLSPNVQPNQTYFYKSIKPRIQAENLANNSRKEFYVILNINQIKLYTYLDLLKKITLLRKLLNSESTVYFLDETFYHTYIPLFSITISAATAIKATKYSTYYIIHHSYDVATKYSIISTETCKVILPGW